MNTIVFARILILFLLLEACQGATWTVNQSDSIQVRIDDASPGDIILVNEGTYYENIFVSKSLILRGNGSPIVDGNGSGSVITLLADGIVLEGLVVMNSSTQSSGSDGIMIISNKNVIKNSTVQNCVTGFNLVNSSSNTIEANIIINNRIGVNLRNSSKTLIAENEIIDNKQGISLIEARNNSIRGNNASENNQQGIRISNSFYNQISNNTVTFNAENGISLIRSNNNILLNNNASFDAQIGISMDDSDNNIFIGNSASYSKNRNGINIINNSNNNTFRHNFASHNGEYGISITQSANNNITGNEASNNSKGGILLSKSRYSILAENRVNHNKVDGLKLGSSGNSNITKNEVINNRVGLFLSESHNCLIAGNDFRNNAVNGVYLKSSLRNDINNNTANNNSGGVAFLNSDINLIKNNAINNNSVGMVLKNSSNNTIAGNNIANNKIGAYLNRSNWNIIAENIIVHNKVGLAFNLSNNLTRDNIYINNTKYDIITNENESILKNLIWKDAILKEDPESFLTGSISLNLKRESLTGISTTSSLRPLTIYSNPSGAEIWVDGKKKGKLTPDTVNIKGKAFHEIKLTLSGYKSKTESYEIRAPTTITIDLSPILTPRATPIASGLDSSKRYATINSVPDGAEIWIDDRFTEKRTPGRIEFNSTGVHSYKLILSGYQNHQGFLDLSESAEANVSLVPEKNSPALDFPGVVLLMTIIFAYRFLKRR
jgi:parallel beta-helix repeat protein